MQDDVTLESVPGFQRPMSANPNDRVVGEDELGRRIYETATGQRYTLSVNPDQRTLRTRVEEDLLPGMQEYLQNPSMPTATEAAGFVRDVAQGAYESLEGAVEGRGTLGDVTGLAVGSGAGSMFGEVPEGALRIFGGFRVAKDPGVDASGNPLPRSIGADELERFEIDDSQASFNSTRVPQQNMSSLNNKADRDRIAQNPEQYFARLDQVLDHPELFRQYPDLGGLRVVEDTSIDPRAGGYYNPTQNLLAVSPNTMRDPDFFRRVIVHEVQHAVQQLEGFDRGTNPQAPEVTARSAASIDEARQMQEEAVRRFEAFDFESRLDEVRDFLQPLLNDIDAEGLVTADEIFFTSPHRAGWTQTLENLATTLEDQNLQGFDAYDALLDFYAFVRENPQIIPEESLEDFTETFKVSVDELSGLRSSDFVDQFEGLDIIPLDPQRLSFLEGDIRERTYTSRSGEVEATNVMDRLGFSLAQRFSEPPEQTEKIMRAEQWRVDPTGQIRDSARQFNTGGVVSMEEQMSLFDMGGLTDDGAMRDPVSGNEIPPGSMASEVRDDVPAMLSEGEYIVPADVVRFFGVKFFEDLRNQAKSGLTDMEQNGRIGGEPVGAPQDDLTPEELQMLAEITGMAQGGMVKGYQQGGMVNRPFTPTPNYNIPGFSLFQPVQAAAPTPTPTVPQTQAMTLYGPNGEIVTLTLPTDQERYNALLGQGYTTEQRVREANVQGGEGGRDETQEAFNLDSQTSESRGLSSEVYGALLKDPLKFGMEQLEAMDFTRVGAGAGNLLGGPALGLVGGAVGAGITLNNVAQARAASQIAAARGLDTTALDRAVDEYVRNLPNISRVASNIFASGDNIARRFFEQEGRSQDPGMTPRPSTDPFAGLSGTALLPPSGAEEGTSLAPTASIRPTPRPTQTPAPAPRQGSSSDRDSGTSLAPTASIRPTPRPTQTPAPAPRPSTPAPREERDSDSDSGSSFAPTSSPRPTPRPDSGGGGGGSSNDGTVICTALYNLGLLDAEVYKLDAQYGSLLESQEPEVLVGYRKLATPLANYIQEDRLDAKIVRSIVAPLAKAWASEMAHTMKPEDYKGNVVGKAIIKVGYPVCAYVGKNIKEVTHAA